MLDLDRQRLEAVKLAADGRQHSENWYFHGPRLGWTIAWLTSHTLIHVSMIVHDPT